MNIKQKELLKDIEEQRKSGDKSVSFFEKFDKFEDVPEDQKTHMRETMFMSNYDQDVLNELPKCLRVMPHKQNTSGFFITIIEKIAELDGDAPDIETEDNSGVKPPQIV